MPAREGQTITLPGTGKNSGLFTSQETRDDAQREKVRSISLDLIDPFPEHPFHVREDEAMNTMVESVRAVGILLAITSSEKIIHNDPIAVFREIALFDIGFF